MKMNILSGLRRLLLWIFAGVVIIGLFIGITKINFNYALANSGGNDFLTRWVATRAFLLERLSPYSNEVVGRIQMIAYGRLALPHEDELRMAYPLYSVVVFAPFALIGNYTLARAAWMTTLEVGAGLLAILSAILVNWKPSKLNTFLLILFTAIGYHNVRTIINGNIVIIVALLMVSAFWAIQRGSDKLAGILLAWTTIKPQLAILLILGIFIWAISRQRWTIIHWTVGWVIGLTILGMCIIPDWLVQDIADISRYPSYTSTGTAQGALQLLWPKMGIWPGRILTIIVEY